MDVRLVCVMAGEDAGAELGFSQDRDRGILQIGEGEVEIEVGGGEG
jgi:hypothetical protein